MSELTIGQEYHYRNRQGRQNAVEVTHVLEEEGACTRKELQLLCHMSESSVLNALEKLIRDDRVVKGKDPEDKRKTVYQIA